MVKIIVFASTIAATVAAGLIVAASYLASKAEEAQRDHLE